MQPFLVTEIDVAAVLVAYCAIVVMCVLSTSAAYRRGRADAQPRDVEVGP